MLFYRDLGCFQVSWDTRVSGVTWVAWRSVQGTWVAGVTWVPLSKNGGFLGVLIAFVKWVSIVGIWDPSCGRILCVYLRYLKPIILK